MFAAGDLVIYGGEGVCRVESVGMPETEGVDKTRAYYTLSPLYRTGQVMTPVDTGVLMRPVMTPAEADAFLTALPELPAEEPAGASQRAIKDHYHAVVTSYDCGRMAAMIKYTCQRRRAAQQRGRKVSQLDEAVSAPGGGSAVRRAGGGAGHRPAGGLPVYPERLPGVAGGIIKSGMLCIPLFIIPFPPYRRRRPAAPGAADGWKSAGPSGCRRRLRRCGLRSDRPPPAPGR